jgi:hypothetical protein
MASREPMQVLSGRSRYWLPCGDLVMNTIFTVLFSTVASLVSGDEARSDDGSAAPEVLMMDLVVVWFIPFT